VEQVGDGHSIETMLRVYAAWTQSATEADLALIERARLATPRRGFNKERERFPPPHAPRAWALDWSLEDVADEASAGRLREYLAERESLRAVP
jgi:hypothetical protein